MRAAVEKEFGNKSDIPSDSSSSQYRSFVAQSLDPTVESKRVATEVAKSSNHEGQTTFFNTFPEGLTFEERLGFYKIPNYTKPPPSTEKTQLDITYADQILALRNYCPRLYTTMASRTESDDCPPADLLSIRAKQLYHLGRARWPVVPNLTGPHRFALVKMLASKILQLWCMIRTKTAFGRRSPYKFPLHHFVPAAMNVFKTGVAIPARLLPGQKNIARRSSDDHSNEPPTEENIYIIPPDVLIRQITPLPGTFYVRHLEDDVISVEKNIHHAIVDAVVRCGCSKDMLAPENIDPETVDHIIFQTVRRIYITLT
jgi:hypothetical protein